MGRGHSQKDSAERAQTDLSLPEFPNATIPSCGQLQRLSSPKEKSGMTVNITVAAARSRQHWCHPLIAALETSASLASP